MLSPSPSQSHLAVVLCLNRATSLPCLFPRVVVPEPEYLILVTSSMPRLTIVLHLDRAAGLPYLFPHVIMPEPEYVILAASSMPRLTIRDAPCPARMMSRHDRTGAACLYLTVIVAPPSSLGHGHATAAFCQATNVPHHCIVSTVVVRITLALPCCRPRRAAPNFIVPLQRHRRDVEGHVNMGTTILK